MTAPPVTGVTTSTVAPWAPTAPAPTPTRPASTPLLVWPYTTSVNVAHTVKVPPVPVLEHVRAGRHAGYDRIVFEFAGPIPGYRVQPVTTLAEDGSGEPVWPGSRNLCWCGSSRPKPTPSAAAARSRPVRGRDRRACRRCASSG